jgi:hypothetical protein
MKIALGPALAIGGVVIVAAMAGGAWWWWKQNAERLEEAAAAAYDEGRKVGAALEERGCVDRAVERHRIADNRSILGTVRTNLFFRACLEASKVEAAFCEGVPAQGEMVATGVWAGQQCIKAGFTDSYCGQIFSQIPDYCASGERAGKLKPAEKPRQ